MYKIRRIVLGSGERDAILIDSETGLPHFYVTLYSTIHLRNASKSVNTIIQNLEAIRTLYLALEDLNLNIEELYSNGKILKDYEVNAICDRLGLKRSELLKSQKEKSKRLSIKKIVPHRMIPTREVKGVGVISKYIKIIYCSQYLKWLAEQFPLIDTKSIQRQSEAFDARRPSKKGRNNINNVEKILKKEQIKKLFSKLEIKSDENPYEDIAVQFRNYLIVKILHNLGIRAGELLCIRVEDCHYDLEIGSHTLSIIRQQDNKHDNRLRQPNVKTQERILQIDERLANYIEEYVRKYRSKFPFARKHPYLFVTHKKGPYCGHPLSQSSLAKMFVQISSYLDFNVHPHVLRHTWNYNFSKLADKTIKKGKMTTQQEEDLRSYMQGWKLGSGTAAIYNQRHIQETAGKVALELQRKEAKDEN